MQSDQESENSYFFNSDTESDSLSEENSTIIGNPSLTSFAIVSFIVVLRDSRITYSLLEESVSSKRLAWCSQGSNQIRVIDFKNKREYEEFQGVLLQIKGIL